ncbi:MAG: hypothetical protein O7C01_03385, partial [Actinobacteria bacterium]|nr:hypothetical protein [Actinomycetota bacterium]
DDFGGHKPGGTGYQDRSFCGWHGAEPSSRGETGSRRSGSFSSDVLSLDFSMNPLSIVLSAVAMLVTAGLSLIPALRTVRRLDISEVVRERAA